LNIPSKEFWRRFDRFLALTHDLDIILQIEVWDRFDFYRDPWQLNPFNPKNNVKAGHGLSELAQKNIKSLRMLTDNINIFECEAHNDLLQHREENLAYCLGNPEKEIAVFFAREGKVVLNTSAIDGRLSIKWLDIMESKWMEETVVEKSEEIMLITPLKGTQAVLVKVMM
jgi:hypothetical protein